MAARQRLDGPLCLQDAIVLARTLQEAVGRTPGQSAQLHSLTSTGVDEALRDFERERTRRKLKISVKSNFMGFALQIPFAPVSLLPASPSMCHATNLMSSMRGEMSFCALWSHGK